MKIRLTAPRALPDGTTFIPRFTAWIELPDDEPTVEVQLEVEIDDLLRPRCLGFSIRPLDDQPVTDDTLRGVSISHLLRRATAEAASWFRFDPALGSSGGFGFLLGADRLDSYDKHFAKAKRPILGSPIRMKFST